jgi:histidine ammonia-lyase
MSTFTITSEWISLETLEHILDSNLKLELSENSKNQILKCRRYLDGVMQNENKII